MNLSYEDDLQVYFNGLIINELGKFYDWDDNHSVEAKPIFDKVTKKDLEDTTKEIFELGF